MGVSGPVVVRAAVTSARWLHHLRERSSLGLTLHFVRLGRAASLEGLETIGCPTVDGAQSPIDDGTLKGYRADFRGIGMVEFTIQIPETTARAAAGRLYSGGEPVIIGLHDVRLSVLTRGWFGREARQPLPMLAGVRLWRGVEVGLMHAVDVDAARVDGAQRLRMQVQGGSV